ncbi:MAG: DUF4097 family beta strand repeat-containing protein [Acidobacteriota bacterium]
MTRHTAFRSTAVLTALLCLAFASPALAFKMTEESTFSYPLTADGRVSLENINGDVRIEAWDRDEVSIEAVKRARSQEALDEATIEIDARADRIHIETQYNQDRRGWTSKRDSASIDYTLYVPRGAELDEIELVNGSLELEGIEGDVNASLVNGRANARGLTGNTEISTVNGQLEVELAELDRSHSVELSSVNGSVRLDVPGRADADIEASTVHGGISNDFGLVVDKGEYVGEELSGSIGNGGARVNLSNVNGSISIRESR